MARKALDYNLRQGFTAGEIRKIECIVNRTPTVGRWDDELVKKVKAWQTEHGIDPDGKVKNSWKGNTWPIILAAFENQTEPAEIRDRSVSVGVWIDDSPERVLQSDYIEKLKKLGIDEGALMINKANTGEEDSPWALRWGRDQIVTVAKLLKNNGIDVMFTVWPRPDRHQIDDMCADLETLIADAEPTGIDLDTEGNWKKKFLSDFQTMEEASTYLIDKLRTIAPGIKLELTTYPAHPELTNAPTLSLQVDVITPQAYSRFNKGKEGYDWNDKFGPWGMQRYALTKAHSIATESDRMPQVTCGLAAWDQAFEDHEPEEAMQRALEAVLSEDVDHVRYWSSKWIVGKKATDYAESFITRIPKKSPTKPKAPEPEVSVDADTPKAAEPPKIPIYDLSDMHKAQPPKCKIANGSVVVRNPENVTGVVIHQTACVFGVAQYQIKDAGGDRDEALRRRGLNVACHALALRKGWIVVPNKILWHVNHANRFNSSTLGLEIEGHYPGLMRKPKRTTWGGLPTPVTETVVETAREAIRYLVEEGGKNGMNIQYIYAHRQSSPTRANDPGEELWRRVVLEYAVPVLGLKTNVSKVLETRKGPGRPIPKDWDPSGIGRF